MKFGQLIEYNVRNIFLEKSYTKCGGKTIPRPFFKKWKFSISLDQYSKVLYFVFIVCQVEDYRKWLKLSCRSLAFTSNKAFLKTKKGLELVSLPHFLHDSWRKTFLLLCSFTWPNFNVWLRLLRELLGNMSIVILC